MIWSIDKISQNSNNPFKNEKANDANQSHQSKPHGIGMTMTMALGVEFRMLMLCSIYEIMIGMRWKGLQEGQINHCHYRMAYLREVTNEEVHLMLVCQLQGQQIFDSNCFDDHVARMAKIQQLTVQQDW